MPYFWQFSKQKCQNCLFTFVYFYKDGEKWIWYDDGPNKQLRIIIFTTKTNIMLLKKTTHVLSDGTFDVPTCYKQLYSIHGQFSGTVLPLFYAYLPGKKSKYYTLMLKAIIAITDVSKN